MKRKIVKMLLVGAIFGLGLAGCGSAGAAGDPDGQEETSEVSDADEEDEDDEPEEPVEPEIVSARDIDYTSEKSILSFLKGTWELADQNTGNVYARLKIDRNGNVTYTMTGSGKECTGTISVGEDYSGYLTDLHDYELVLEGIKDTFDTWGDTDRSSGRFMIAQTPGRDYLMLQEIGNGGSSIAFQVLASPEQEEEYGSMNWIFTRDNDVNEEATPESNGEFYGMALESEGGRLLIQELDAVQLDDCGEYTNYRFRAAMFDESAHQEAFWYGVSPDADLSGILHESEMDEKYPLEVYTVSVENGQIVSLRDVKEAYYGEYELYPLEQEVTWDGTYFYINGEGFNSSDFCEGNAIMDCEILGDKVLIESHINPHMSAYLIYNMRAGWPEKTIYGGCFIHGDKVFDSFYADMDTVYDYSGMPVYTVDGVEIKDLSFTDGDRNIRIEYWKDDYTDVYEEVIERPECLNAPIYLLADFRRNNTAERWAELLDSAGGDAGFMVMVNPYPDDTWDFWQPVEIGEYGSDRVVIVSLHDGTEFSVGREYSIVLDKGEIAAFNMTVPEGGPEYTIYARTPDGSKYEWPVTVITGKDDTRWKFVR